MRTPKQTEAARTNGRKSKDRIRTNALKHGLTARLVMWKNEDPAQFQALLVTLLEQFAPANDLEFLCVEEMAMAKWRQRRVMSIESAAANKELADRKPGGSEVTLAAFTAAQQQAQLLTTLRQHEAAYGRAYQRAYRHLMTLREQAHPTRKNVADLAA